MNKSLAIVAENLNDAMSSLDALLKQNITVVALSHASHTKPGHPDTYTIIVIYIINGNDSSNSLRRSTVR